MTMALPAVLTAAASGASSLPGPETVTGLPQVPVPVALTTAWICGVALPVTQTVSAGPPGATAKYTEPTLVSPSGAGELAVGFYADSGFGDILKPAGQYTQRANLSPTTTMMEQLAEDKVVGAGAQPAATVQTGARTPWMMATDRKST